MYLVRDFQYLSWPRSCSVGSGLWDWSFVFGGEGGGGDLGIKECFLFFFLVLMLCCFRRIFG